MITPSKMPLRPISFPGVSHVEASEVGEEEQQVVDRCTLWDRWIDRLRRPFHKIYTTAQNYQRITLVFLPLEDTQEAHFSVFCSQEIASFGGQPHPRRVE